MVEQWPTWKTKLWAWAAFAVVVAVIFLWETYSPAVVKAEQELNQEFKKIENFPGAVKFGFDSGHKSNQAHVDAYFRALVGAVYPTRASYEGIKGWYVQELQKKGWKYIGESTVEDEGVYLGGKELTFEKGKYEAVVQFGGEKAHYDWDYALSLSWAPMKKIAIHKQKKNAP